MIQNSPHIAVIGLGAMGLPMATHLAKTFTVTGFEPYAARREEAEQAGINAESTPAAACRPTQAMILVYLHTVKDGSGDDRVACLFKVNVSALVKSKSSLG